MFSSGNPFTAAYRLFNFRAPSLTAATALAGTKVNQPFIANIAATTAIILPGAAGHAHIQFHARDALGNPETNAVEISVGVGAAAQTVTSATAATGTVYSAVGLTTKGLTFKVVPGALGLVDIDVLFSGTVPAAEITIENRGIRAAGLVAVA